MNNISCSIIEDLLPLYHDNVCNPESRQLVEEHLKTCPRCLELYQSMKTEVEVAIHMNEAAPIKRIARKWKADRLSSFLRGGCLISFLASFASFMMYNLSGSYVAEDGRVVEAFGFY